MEDVVTIRENARAEIRRLDEQRRRFRRQHAISRAYERYGLRLNWIDLMAVEMLIEAKRFCLIDEHGDDVSPFYAPNTRRLFCTVELYGQHVNVLYDDKYKEIITFLPSSIFELGDEYVEHKQFNFVTQQARRRG